MLRSTVTVMLLLMCVVRGLGQRVVPIRAEDSSDVFGTGKSHYTRIRIRSRSRSRLTGAGVIDHYAVGGPD